MKRSLFAAFLTIAALSCTGANAQLTAIDVVNRAELGNQAIQREALIFAGGVLGGALSVEGLHVEEKKPLVICLPDDKMLSPQELVAMVKEAISTQPTARDQDFRLVA